MVQFNSETRVGINGIKWDMTKNNDNNVQIMAFCGYNIGMYIYTHNGIESRIHHGFAQNSGIYWDI